MRSLGYLKYGFCVIFFFRLSQLACPTEPVAFAGIPPTVSKNATVYFAAFDRYVYAFSKGGNMEWEYFVGDDVSSPLTVSEDGTVYFGTADGYLFAVSRNGKLSPNGKLKWKFKTERFIMSAPVISPEGMILFGGCNRYEKFIVDGVKSYKCTMGALYVLRPNGDLLWTYKTENAIDSSPAISNDDVVYFTGCNVFKPDGYTCKESFLKAIDYSKKLRIWEFTVEEGHLTSPIIAKNGIIYSGGDKYLYALDSSGQVIWKFAANVSGPPAITSDGVIYFGSSDGNMYALDVNGNLKWKFHGVDGIAYVPPAVSRDGNVYIGGSNLKAISSSGELKWKHKEKYWISNPVLTEDNVIVFQIGKCKLVYLSPDGSVKWTFECKYFK